jgi:hypothetical protein
MALRTCLPLCLVAACASPRTPVSGPAHDGLSGFAPELALPAESATAGSAIEGPAPASAVPASHKWRQGETALQGWIGAAFYDYELDGSATFASADESVTAPCIGGGAQWKLGGERIDFGIEGMLGFAWRGGSSAFVSSGGGAAIAVDVDVYLFELFGGPFANVFLGDKVRVYGAAGPVLQWANYEQDSINPTGDGTGDGFGAGYYVRTGVEFDAGTNTMLGIGVRWTDSVIDLGGRLGDLDLQGVQVVLSLTQNL